MTAETIRSALLEAATAIGGESPRLDAELLLGAVVGGSRAWLFAHADDPLAEGPAQRFRELWRRRAAGEPVAYLLGRRNFWTLDLAVDPSTLIPRPETELLVELALERLDAQADVAVADLGTGSGAIALAVAAERPRLRVVAVERAPGALAVARRNLARSGLANVELRAGSWFEPLAGERFSLILSNPPYLAEDDPHLALGDLRFEPHSALVAGRDGLDDIRAIAAAAAGHLEADGWLLVEHGATQGEAARAILAAAGLQSVCTRRDLAGHERVTCGQRPG